MHLAVNSHGHLAVVLNSSWPHLLDAAGIPLPTSICSLLRYVVNFLASAHPSQSFLRADSAGGSLTALNKQKKGCSPDRRPITVGESLR